MVKTFLLLSSVLSALLVFSRSGLGLVEGATIGSNLKADFKRVRRNLYKSIHDYIDTAVNPCDDFYLHACGNWEKLNPIPDDVVDYKPIKALSYQIDLIVKDFLGHGVQDGELDSAEAKAKIFYASCVNQTERNQLGVQPMVALFETLGGWPVLKGNWSKENFDWLETIAVLRRYGDRILIKESVNYNKKNSTNSIIYLDQPALGLGNRADYLDNSYEFRLNAYRNYIKQVLRIFGVDSEMAEQAANETVAFETQLAKILALPHERVNISIFADDISVNDLQMKVSNIDWTKYLSTVFERSILPSERVVIKEYKYMNDLASLIQNTETRVVANYIFWRFAQFKVIRLSSEFEKPLQEYFGVILGRKTTPAQWKTCINDVSYHMREAIGAMFNHNYFDETDREKVAEMVHHLKEAFLEIIYNSTWVDANTKTLIQKKLDHMIVQIGYPDLINSEQKVNTVFDKLTITPSKYFANYLNLLRHSARMKHDRLLQSDKNDDWSSVSPDLTSAYYNPAKNKISIPAGLLQDPLFNKFFTRAFNYGRMGALIGHEMSHAFDNIGRHYDFNGNINPWWSQTIIDLFNEKSDCFSQQYSQYRIQDSKHMLDSRGTLSENIADNGGVLAAYKAYKDLSGEDGDVVAASGANYDGGESEVLSDDAIFFYSFAQLWCGHIRPEAVLTQTRRDPHSPGMWRVIGALSNSEDFAKVFNCSRESPMNPIKKCRIW